MQASGKGPRESSTIYIFFSVYNIHPTLLLIVVILLLRYIIILKVKTEDNNVPIIQFIK